MSNFKDKNWKNVISNRSDQFDKEIADGKKHYLPVTTIARGDYR